MITRIVVRQRNQKNPPMQGFFGVGKVNVACITEGQEKWSQKQVIISMKEPQTNSRPKQAIVYFKRVGSCALST